MMEFKILFSNIFQGLTFLGTNEKEEEFVKDDGFDAIINDILDLNPDICCFAEMVFDNKGRESRLIDELSSQLGYKYSSRYIADKCFYEPVLDKYYGGAILSRYPLKNESIVDLPNPRLECRQADGSLWVMHDKPVQSVDVKISEGKFIKLFNIHSFPFHRFGRSLKESEFDKWKESFEASFDLSSEMPKVIVGDFNNKDVSIESLLPSAFNNQRLSSIISFSKSSHSMVYHRSKVDEAKGLVYPEQKYGHANSQVDYMLVSPEIKPVETCSIIGRSDHPSLFASLKYI